MAICRLVTRQHPGIRSLRLKEASAIRALFPARAEFYSAPAKPPADLSPGGSRSVPVSEWPRDDGAAPPSRALWQLPLEAQLAANLPEPLLLGAAFGVGGGAQQVLMSVIRRVSGPKKEPPQ